LCVYSLRMPTPPPTPNPTPPGAGAVNTPIPTVIAAMLGTFNQAAINTIPPSEKVRNQAQSLYNFAVGVATLANSTDTDSKAQYSQLVNKGITLITAEDAVAAGVQLIALYREKQQREAEKEAATASLNAQRDLNAKTLADSKTLAGLAWGVHSENLKLLGFEPDKAGGRKAATKSASDKKKGTDEKK
jgi:hypothetical protein